MHPAADASWHVPEVRMALEPLYWATPSTRRTGRCPAQVLIALALAIPVVALGMAPHVFDLALARHVARAALRGARAHGASSLDGGERHRRGWLGIVNRASHADRARRDRRVWLQRRCDIRAGVFPAA
jgi:hypothetical protein